MKGHHIILFTAEFPFGISEPFLETEIVFLAEAYDKVTIVCRNTQLQTCRKLPSNCEVIRNTFALSTAEKFAGLRHLFSKNIREERSYAKKTLKLKFDWAQLKTVLVSYTRGRKIAAFAEKIAAKHSNFSNLFYSYWADDCAVGLALLRTSTKEVKCITRAHGWDLYFEASEINYLPFRKLISTHLNGVFTISEVGYNYCDKFWKVQDKKVLQLARLGVVKRTFETKEEAPFTIVSCANLIPLKRVDLLIDALSILELQAPIRWVHFGQGPLEEQLRNHASTKLGPDVVFQFMGHIDNVDLMDWYSENRPALFVNTSTTEGIPVSIMEAMSFGTPVLATNVGGTSEIVNQTNGVLLDANICAADLSKELSKWINFEKSKRMTYRKAAFDSCNEKFSATKNYTRFVGQLKEL